jgi:hypothetical protein
MRGTLLTSNNYGSHDFAFCIRSSDNKTGTGQLRKLTARMPGSNDRAERAAVTRWRLQPADDCRSRATVDQATFCEQRERDARVTHGRPLACRR